jgi:hypothetical protein
MNILRAAGILDEYLVKGYKNESFSLWKNGSVIIRVYVNPTGIN